VGRVDGGAGCDGLGVQACSERSGGPVSAFEEHRCRVYWGHCGCDLYRGHPGPHVGLHWDDDAVEVMAVHVMGPDTPGYEHIFGEDAPRER